MTDKVIIKNAHCKYFEGQTGLCQAKEFKRCNPINCSLYTIDELSTIKDLQQQLQRKEQECEELRKEKELYKTWYQTKHDDWADVFFKTIKSRDRYKQALEKIEEIIHNKSIITYEIRNIKAILNEVTNNDK